MAVNQAKPLEMQNPVTQLKAGIASPSPAALCDVFLKHPGLCAECL